MKLTEYGSAAGVPQLSKEDERSAALARRAQQGDYDEGKDLPSCSLQFGDLLNEVAMGHFQI